MPASTITQYPLAIAKGAVLGLKDNLDILLHPVTHLLRLSLFVFDVSTIALSQVHRAHLPDGHAIERMRKRADNIKQLGIYIKNATGLERAEIVSRVLTGTVSMNGALKVLINTRPTILRNLRDFGRIEEPPKFKNLYHDDPPVYPTFEPISSAQLRQIPGSYEGIYVFREDRKLVIAACDLETPIIRNGHPSLLLHHHDLAQGQLVYAAGHVFSSNGQIEWITEVSGHFLPYGDHLPRVVEHVFARDGFRNVAGTYKEFFADGHKEKGIMIKSETKIYSLSIEQKAIVAVNASVKTKKESEQINPPKLITPMFQKKSSLAKSKFFSIPLTTPNLPEKNEAQFKLKGFNQAKPF